MLVGAHCERPCADGEAYTVRAFATICSSSMWSVYRSSRRIVTPHWKCTSVRCGHSRSSSVGRPVGLYVPPFHFDFCVAMCVLDGNSLTSLLWRSLESRSVRLNRQRRSASSQKQTRRCPRARCSSQRMRRRRRRSKAVSEREQA